MIVLALLLMAAGACRNDPPRATKGTQAAAPIAPRPDAAPADDLYIAYHHDAQSAYEDVVVDGDTLHVRWLDPTIVHGTTKTGERKLSPAEKRDLAALVDRGGFLKSSDEDGTSDPNPNAPSSPYTITARHGGVKRTLTYHARPNGPKMQPAFAALQEKMEDLLRGFLTQP
jgi:hypothetical protein